VIGASGRRALQTKRCENDPSSTRRLSATIYHRIFCSSILHSIASYHPACPVCLSPRILLIQVQQVSVSSSTPVKLRSRDMSGIIVVAGPRCSVEIGGLNYVELSSQPDWLRSGDEAVDQNGASSPPSASLSEDSRQINIFSEFQRTHLTRLPTRFKLRDSRCGMQRATSPCSQTGRRCYTKLQQARAASVPGENAQQQALIVSSCQHVIQEETAARLAWSAAEL
jgi:hypothetical protein